MKTLLLSLLLFNCFSCFAQGAFKGDWFEGKSGDDIGFAVIKIGANTSFTVVDNQLDVYCRNVYKQDTLLLYVIETDQGRGFMGPKFYPPKPKSLFAKCFIVNKEMKIIYTQKLFYNNIKALGLLTTVYKHD